MAWFIAATLAAFFIKGLCGFANTLIFQSILSFSVNNADISPVELVPGKRHSDLAEPKIA